MAQAVIIQCGDLFVFTVPLPSELRDMSLLGGPHLTTALLDLGAGGFGVTAQFAPGTPRGMRVLDIKSLLELVWERLRSKGAVEGAMTLLADGEINLVPALTNQLALTKLVRRD